MVEFGSAQSLLHELRRRFPKASIEPADATLKKWMKRVIGAIDEARPDPGLPLDVRGTAFQMRVWNALTTLTRGETLAYAELAERIGAPGSARAVARACATNGIAVLVPCHRVVASDGALTGYKWGIQRKRRLLQKEQAAD
jgi:AraC family transcriptional regulator of adaptative response/methylated-DNA-[protein]-cysteine methyltransferase